MKYALIAAGEAVTADDLDHILMTGVPAKRISWVCEFGQVLDKELCCQNCGRKHENKENSISEVKTDAVP